MVVENPRTKNSSIDRIYGIYESWPEHFEKAAMLKLDFQSVIKKFSSVVLCGMGGSATGCDIIHDLLNIYGTVPSIVIRGGHLPCMVNADTLALIFSASGNTEETLHMAEQAIDKKAEVVCITAGGKLMEFAESKGLYNLKIPSLGLPRAVLPYLLIPGLKIVGPFLKLPIEETIAETHRSLSQIRDEISAKVPLERNVAKRLANFMYNSFVFCFTSPTLMSVGTRFKNSLNENAKVHCARDSILEASHNEIVPFTYPTEPEARRVIFVKWKQDHELVKKRFNKVRNLYSEIGQLWLDYECTENNLLIAFLSSIYTLDYSSIYAGELRNVDPSATPAIDILKKT